MPDPDDDASDVRRAEDDAVLRAFAHDVRSIGAAAEGLAFRAASRVDDARVRSYLEAIRESMARLSAMSAAALELARSGEQAIRTTGETIDVSCVARTLATTMEEAFADAGASCVLALEEGRVFADRTALYRMMLNLLTNALVHGTHARGSSVELSVRREGARVRVRVADEGPGFPRALLGTFPAPSWQAGRGLGLSIVARLASRWGGALEIGNGHARGAVVTLDLPAVA